MSGYETPGPTPARKRGRGRILKSALILLALALLVAGGYHSWHGGWQLWQRHTGTEDTLASEDTQLRGLTRQVAEQHADLETLRQHAADLAGSQRQDSEDIAALKEHGNDFDHALAQLSAAVQGGRVRAQLIAIEQLLLIANDRAQLAHDAPGAAAALEAAQEQLATLSEPRLFEVRKALADEQAALLAVPPVDRIGVGLALASLIDNAPKLLLRSQPPLPPALQATDDHGGRDGIGARGWAAVKQVFGALFVIRRTDAPVAPLLPPEQEALVVEILQLRLESARSALLVDQTAGFRAALGSAEALLDEDYRKDDPAVAAAHDELESLKKLELAPPLPDLSRGLGLLRAYLDAQPH